MSKRLTEERQIFFARTFIEFINYFFSKGAPPDKIKEMLCYMVDEIEKDRESLT